MRVWLRLIIAGLWIQTECGMAIAQSPGPSPKSAEVEHEQDDVFINTATLTKNPQAGCTIENIGQGNEIVVRSGVDWDVKVGFSPKIARDNLYVRIIQIETGVIRKYYNNTALFGCDGVKLDTTDDWHLDGSYQPTYESYSTSQIDASKQDHFMITGSPLTYKMFYFDNAFEIYIQYKIGEQGEWKTLKRGNWHVGGWAVPNADKTGFETNTIETTVDDFYDCSDPVPTYQPAKHPSELQNWEDFSNE